ncbi:MAG: aminoacyl-tRNA hydrolase [Calditrichaeota bacterium]|nr:aminoacyl-tRNA hydrolase [Calditrichota bacterium]
MIRINQNIEIDESEIKFDFIRSSGPGGQNVNKVATAAQLRFNVQSSTSLPENVRERLIKIAGKRLTVSGDLIITARRFRTQERNRKDALERLIKIIQDAAIDPPIRKKLKPSATAKRKRIEEKRRQSKKKQHRRFLPEIEES